MRVLFIDFLSLIDVIVCRSCAEAFPLFRAFCCWRRGEGSDTFIGRSMIISDLPHSMMGLQKQSIDSLNVPLHGNL